jgi:hypothetical protein
VSERQYNKNTLKAVEFEFSLQKILPESTVLALGFGRIGATKRSTK